MNEKNIKYLSYALFSIYIFTLGWIILFKLSFSFDTLPSIRNINLVPFSQSVIVNGKIQLSELINNILIFIPLGVFINMFIKKSSILKKIIIIILVSLSLESFQYILSIGASDITDIITNTTGGIIGLGLYDLFERIWKEKTYKYITILGTILTIICILLITVLIVIN